MNHATIVHDAGAETTTVTGFERVEVLAVDPEADGLASLRVEFRGEEVDGETFHRAFVEDAYGGVMSSLTAVVGDSYAEADREPVRQATIPPLPGEGEPDTAEGPVAFLGVTFAKRVISAERGPRVVLVSEEDYRVVHPPDGPFDPGEAVPRGDLPGNQSRAGPDILSLQAASEADLEVSLDAAVEEAIDDAIEGPGGE